MDADEVLSLPMSPYLSEIDQQRVIDALIKTENSAV